MRSCRLRLQNLNFADGAVWFDGVHSAGAVIGDNHEIVAVVEENIGWVGCIVSHDVQALLNGKITIDCLLYRRCV